MHRAHQDSGSNYGNDREQTAGEYDNDESRHYKLRACDRSDGGKKFDVAGAHRAKNVKHEHQKKREGAAREARVNTVHPADDCVHDQTAAERGEHECIWYPPVANIVVTDDDGQRY